MEVICPYCGKPAEFVDSNLVYGRSFGMIYLCAPCDARVGVKKGTDIPIGTLADALLREHRKLTHAVFDPLWKSRQMTRSKAYLWLSRRMGLNTLQCHIGKFNVEQCQKAIQLVRSRNLGNETK